VATAQSFSVQEEGAFRIHKCKQPIGEEHYLVITRSVDVEP
jgi:hypothetical protein